MAHIQRYSGAVKRLALRLTEPDTSIIDKEVRENARLITGLLLIAQVLLFVVFPIRYILFLTDENEKFTRLSIVLLSGLFIHVMYHFARRGRHQAVALCVGIVGTLIIFGTAAVLGTEGVATLYYPMIITLFISIFVSRRAATLLILFQLASTLMLGLFAREVPLFEVLVGPFSFTVLSSFFILVFTLFREMIESHRAETIRTNEERLHAAIQGSLDPFYMVEPLYNEGGVLVDFKIVDVNSPARKQAGYARSQLIGMGMMQVFPNLRNVNMLERYYKVLMSGVALEEEFMLPLDNGFEWFHHQIVPVGTGLAITNRDITEEKSTARAMEQLNKELISLYETAAALASTLDLSKIYQIIYHELGQKLYDAKSFSISDYDSEQDRFIRRYIVRDGIERPNELGMMRNTPNKYAAIHQRRPIIWSGEKMNVRDGSEPYYELNFSLPVDNEATMVRTNSSELHIPMFNNNQPIGLISVYHNAPDYFHDSDLSMLMTIAGQAASAISNARLYNRAQQEIHERKVIENALRESEQNFRLLAENSPDTIYIMSLPEWKLEYFNDDVFLGYTRAEIQQNGSLMQTAVHKDDQDRLLRHWERILTGEIDNNGLIEYRMKNAEGAWEWVQSREVIMQRYEDRKPARVLVALTVITERKQGEETLRQSEEKFRLLAENSPDTIYILSLPDLTLKYVNHDHVVGHPVSMLFNDPGMRPFMHPDDLETLAEHRQMVIENRVNPRDYIEYRILNGRGEWDWVQSRVSTMGYQENGIPTMAIVTLTVITERKKAEAALRESEEKFRSIAEISPDIIYILSVPDRELLYINKDNIIGHPLEAIIDTGLEPYIHSADLERLTLERAQLFAGQQDMFTQQSEYRLRNSQDEWDWVQSRQVVMELREDGTPSKLMVALTVITERKQAEAALRQSEARYRAVIQGQTELVSRYKPDLTLTFVNDAYSRFFGSSNEVMVGRNISEFLPPEDIEAAHLHVQSVIASDKPLVHIHRTYRADGVLRWFQWTDNAIRDDNGEVIEIQATGLDITERLMAEEALRASEAHSRAIIAAMPDMIFILNKDGVFEDSLVSDHSRLLLPAETFIGASLQDIMPDIESRVQPAIEAALETGTLQTLEYYLDVKESREYYEARIIAYDQDKVLSFVRDITERKRAEEALRQSEEVFRQITDNIDEIFFIVDRATSKIVYMSPAYEDIFGLKRDDLYQDPTHYRRVIHPDDVALYNEQTDLMNREKKQLDFEYRIIREPDKQVRWVWLRTFFIYGEDDNVWRIVGIVEDITERRMVQAQILEVTRERERQELLRSLISDISHDLMTPLTVMRTGLHLMRNPEAQDRKIERIGRIDEQVTHLQEMLEDMLSMAKLERPVRDEFSFVEDDITPLLLHFVESMQPLADVRGYNLSADFCEMHPVIRHDRGKLQRALTNLVDNAMKYTPEGTNIRLRSYCEQTGTLIIVEDDGQGIPSEALPHIFDRFYRVQNHRPDTSGTGLGLAITKKIIEAHGGHITVSSEEGKGTRFTIWLPKVGSMRQ